MVGMETSRPKLRWYQYSLRTLFIFVTLVCIVFGLYIGPKHRRHQAVVAIEEAGGDVQCVNAPDDEWWFKRTLREFLPPDWIDEVVRIDLSNRRNADEHVFAVLERFNELKVLRLSGTQITDAGLIHLTGLTGLEELDLRGTQISNAGLVHLKGLSGLYALNLRDTQTTGAGLADLKNALPHCYVVDDSPGPSPQSPPADDASDKPRG